MTEDDEFRLRHMLDYARRGVRALGGQSFDAFVDDDKAQLALERAVELIGEAASKVPKELQAELPDIAWRDIIGMRQVLAHGYMHVDYGVLYRVAREELPRLISLIEKGLGETT